MRRIILVATVALLMTAMLAIVAGTAAAHPHFVSNLWKRMRRGGLWSET